MPWQAPQSWRTMRINLFWRATVMVLAASELVKLLDPLDPLDSPELLELLSAACAVNPRCSTNDFELSCTIAGEAHPTNEKISSAMQINAL
jgi:hypothetical protein